ncbi:pumilio homolog 5 [Macadamia integrifolia]|uniref:pumilio homolog 5 n=1 Tax=Macadamia integrifolia TaxID=60698 RepID=UPI001C501F49|nr:pumilio homolog 5 [Macadamia integrifolia]XP_042497151.1 pumilio homolog 5 [Macadamia integrifolia]XP_042497152.1 pumilio homolog 5 [Macadamia integrifolia]
MATESPVRLVESTGARNWSSSKEAATFASSSHSMAAEELGLLLNGQRFHGTGRDAVPNRSGSAPPSMEGSFAAMGNLIAQNSSLDTSLASLKSALENCESEEQLRADPAYLAYYCSNVNLNPRLPPPLISRENRRLVHHMGGFGNKWRLTSLDDSGDESVKLSRGTLSTHKEEPEDDRSPRQVSGDWAERSSLFPGQQSSSLAGRHKSLVDLIQEDFPRTPSPVYNQSRSSSHAATEEGVDHDALVTSLHDPPNNTSKLLDGTISNGDSSSAPVLSSSSSHGMGSPHPSQIGGSSSVDTNLEDDVLITGMTDPDIISIESEFKALDISSLPNSDHRNRQEWQHPQPNNSQNHNLRPQRGTASQVQGGQSQMISQGMHRQYIGSDQFSLGHSKFSAVEGQLALQSSGIIPPLYATATAYMASGNPFYPNLQPSGLFAPQYGVGGYALNTALLPPFVAGYPPQSAIPMAFDGTAGPSFSARPASVSTGGSIGPGVDLQHLYKYYGLAIQPPFDPLYMQYIQHSSDDAYPLASRIMRTQMDTFDSQKASPAVAYPADQNSQYPRSAGVTIPSPRKGGISSPNLYSSPPGMGVLMQFPTSPLASPVMPGSPMGGTSLPGGRNEMRFPVGSSRNPGVYSGWRGQRGAERFDDPKTYSFLEELKSSKARRFELSDIAGRIVEFSSDQHGSRFIQQKLETCSVEEKISVFKEVLPHASKLMIDVFGNYVIQKFFEHGSPEQRKELANQLTGHILPLSLQMYGCRVIQKALEVIELEQKTKLVLELDGHVMRCVRDQNGNHVIQKCIECVPTQKIGFIISAFHGQVASLSTHPYGCRVIQRVLEHCTDDLQSQCIVDEILESACALAQDQYGNYVTQHVLERGKPHERSQIISKLSGKIVQMSQHKFASNVVEKCLEHGDATERELLVEEIVGQTEGNDNLLAMMKDQFANYVVQKILEMCTDKQREVLLNRIRVHLHALKKYTYGKHIVARFEQLYGEEIQALEP